MGFCCADCKDVEHTCTAWDGNGSAGGLGFPQNHNLVETCPVPVTKCEYRKKKMPSGASIK